MKILKKIASCFFKMLDYVEEISVVLLLAIMTILNFANVLSRYVFKTSLSFTEELIVMAFVWVSFIGIAIGYKRFAHLGMSYIVDHLPKKVQAVFALLSCACSVVLMWFMITNGFEMVAGQIRLGGKTPALHLPLCLQGYAIPICGILIGIRALQAGITLAVKLWKEKKTDNCEEGEGEIA